MEGIQAADVPSRSKDAGSRSVRRGKIIEWVLFLLAIGLYLSTRLVGLERFPIYFFTDEAVQTVMEDFVQDDLRNYTGGTNTLQGHVNLSSVSVYLQVVFTWFR
jgi:hypothetical protein